jgi:hypothetical protein
MTAHSPTNAMVTILEDLNNETSFFVSQAKSARHQGLPQPLQLLKKLQSITSPVSFHSFFPKTSSSFFLRLTQTTDSDDYLHAISKHLYLNHGLYLHSSHTGELIRYSTPSHLRIQSHAYRNPTKHFSSDPTCTTIRCPRTLQPIEIKLIIAQFGHYHSLTPLQTDDPFNISHLEFSLHFSHQASALLAHRQNIDNIAFSTPAFTQSALDQLLTDLNLQPTLTIDERLNACEQYGAATMMENILASFSPSAHPSFPTTSNQQVNLSSALQPTPLPPSQLSELSHCDITHEPPCHALPLPSKRLTQTGSDKIMTLTHSVLQSTTPSIPAHHPADFLSLSHSLTTQPACALTLPTSQKGLTLIAISSPLHLTFKCFDTCLASQTIQLILRPLHALHISSNLFPCLHFSIPKISTPNKDDLLIYHHFGSN